MSDKDKIDIELPPKPYSPMRQAVLLGSTGAVVGAGASALWQAARNIGAGKKPFSPNHILEFAMNVGLTAALIGWYTAKGEAREHGLKVDNVKLQHKVEALEAEKIGMPKSFVEDVTASKEAKEPPQISR